jgi:hypothetical protein
LPFNSSFVGGRPAIGRPSAQGIPFCSATLQMLLMLALSFSGDHKSFCASFYPQFLSISRGPSAWTSLRRFQKLFYSCKSFGSHLVGTVPIQTLKSQTLSFFW